MLALLRIILAIAALACLSACSPVKLPQMNDYRLSSVANVQLTRSPSVNALLVLAPTAASGFDVQNMIYMRRPYQLESYAHNEWVAPPAEMMQPLVIESLLNTGYFAAVVGPPFTGDTRFKLKTTILKIEQDYTRRPAEARLVIKFDVFDDRRNRIIATKRFYQAVPMRQAGPYDGVVAMNEASQQILDRMATFVVDVCRRASVA